MKACPEKGYVEHVRDSVVDDIFKLPRLPVILPIIAAVMVGDREQDIIAAREAGILEIGVLYGYGERAELESVHAKRMTTFSNFPAFP